MVKVAVRVVIWVYIAWLALTVLVLLPALNFLAPWYMQEEYGRELRTDIILFNPFTLSAEIRGADLREPDGSPFARLDLARVNLSLESLFAKGIVFDDITVTGLGLSVRRRSDGSASGGTPSKRSRQ